VPVLDDPADLGGGPGGAKGRQRRETLHDVPERGRPNQQDAFRVHVSAESAVTDSVRIRE
jgi:hypothetical protein